MQRRAAGGGSAEAQIWLNSVNRKNKAALLEWMKTMDIKLIQVNGQRIYRDPSPGWIGEAPPLGSEIFITGLPQEIYENTLLPLFRTVGKLYEFRLMMTFSGLNRGFAYARYFSNLVAGQAIAQFNGYEILPGSKIVVCQSTEKNELVLDGLPLFLDRAMLEDDLRKKTNGICKVFLCASPTTNRKSMAVLKYDSHREAAIAKKHLCEDDQDLYGCPFTVHWLQEFLKQNVKTGTLPKIKSSIKTRYNDVKQETLAPSAVQRLQLICEAAKLGQPVYQIKFLSRDTSGQLRIWYWVMVPSRCKPFMGSFQLAEDRLTPTEIYQQAKEMVARLILRNLGFGMD